MSNCIYKIFSGERWTPFLLAKKINASALLESASFSHGRDRFSLLMMCEAFRAIEQNDEVYFLINGEKKPAVFAKRDEGAILGENPCAKKGDILDALVYIAAQNNVECGDIPLPASGIGYLGYEFCAKCDTIILAPQKDELEIPECEFIIGHIYAIFDHFTQQIHVFALNYNEHSIDLEREIAKLEKILNDFDVSNLSEEEPQTARIITNLDESKKIYKNQVNTLKNHIIKGDVLQAVPSRRLQIECATSALEVYRRLRTLNPSPYLFYIDFGAHQIVGASPESLVRVRNNIASIRPIAGTIRRGKNNAEDEKLKLELLENPKERAEHLMLVDLARNDLGRVCKSGSVKVERFMKCEVFSHVIHLVSDVSGELDGKIHASAVLRASFPAGTLSGAPKIKAIELVSNLEPIKRSFYAGAVGYIDVKGDLDFCIVIRSALKKGKIWTLQAGSGIVYDSQDEREWEETNEKLGALLCAIMPQ